MPELQHMLRAPMYLWTKCKEPAPRMTDVRRALIDQGVLTECPRCFPAPKPPPLSVGRPPAPRTGWERLRA